MKHAGMHSRDYHHLLRNTPQIYQRWRGDEQPALVRQQHKQRRTSRHRRLSSHDNSDGGYTASKTSAGRPSRHQRSDSQNRSQRPLKSRGQRRSPPSTSSCSTRWRGTTSSSDSPRLCGQRHATPFSCGQTDAVTTDEAEAGDTTWQTGSRHGRTKNMKN